MHLRERAEREGYSVILLPVALQQAIKAPLTSRSQGQQVALRTLSGDLCAVIPFPAWTREHTTLMMYPEWDKEWIRQVLHQYFASRTFPASTYILSNRSSHEDLVRLQIQDHLLTQGMGGGLPEQPDPTALRRVLDVGCGTGGWLIEVARAYPAMDLLIGVDSSCHMVTTARAQAQAAGVSDRVEFHVMDALRMLEFPNASFDLVNQRADVSYLRTWDWPKLLQEYRRVLRPRGMVRIMEGEWTAQSTSPALTRLFELLLHAFPQAGHSFAPMRDGVTSELPRLLEHHGFHEVRTRPLTLTYQAATPAWQSFVQDMALTVRLLLPFLQKWIHVPESYQQVDQQALEEMRQPGFVAHGTLLIVWGAA